MTKWPLEKLQRYIDDRTEEQLQLEYKAAASLDRQNDKTTEITKDVSAMANSDGGVIIYGIKEFSKPNNHLPEKIDPIDRNKFSKEWLEDIIDLIRPRIDGVLVTPVPTSGNDVCYVVEIPTGTTAHQARDHKYYKRHNFKAVPMEDYEVRLVMNRGTSPNVSIRFESRHTQTGGQGLVFRLEPIVKNEGNQVVNHLKLVFSSPGSLLYNAEISGRNPNAGYTVDSQGNYSVTFQTGTPLFPEDERNLGIEIQWHYTILKENLTFLNLQQVPHADATVSWKLYADNMTPKTGTVSYYELHC